MTNKPMLSVEREMLERWTTGRVSLSHLAEMRALLDKPADKICAVCKGFGRYQDGDSGTDEDGRCPNVVDCDCDNSERMPEYRTKPAAQHQGEPVAGKCDQDVYDKGHSVCLVDIPKETAEVICLNVSAATGLKFDWHYIGGRVHIKALLAEKPAPVSVDAPELSGEELEFLKSVHAYSGSKLHSCFGEDGSALWPRLEEIGLIKCLGSYKWELTFDAVAMGIKARLNGVNPVAVDAPKIEFVACTAYNMGGDGYAEQTKTCCGSCPGGCVAGLNGVKP